MKVALLDCGAEMVMSCYKINIFWIEQFDNWFVLEGINVIKIAPEAALKFAFYEEVIWF